MVAKLSTQEVADIRGDFEKLPALIDLGAIAQTLKWSKGRINSLVQRGGFPRPVRTIGRLRYWSRRSVVDFLAGRQAIGKAS